MPLTQTQLVAAVAERADLTRADAKRVLAALDEVVLGEIGNAQKVRIGGLVQLTPRVKPATKKRQGRNPATGEEITIAAKPASVDLRARPLAKAKGRLAVHSEGPSASGARKSPPAARRAPSGPTRLKPKKKRLPSRRVMHAGRKSWI